MAGKVQNNRDFCRGGVLRLPVTPERHGNDSVHAAQMHATQVIGDSWEMSLGRNVAEEGKEWLAVCGRIWTFLNILDPYGLTAKGYLSRMLCILLLFILLFISLPFRPDSFCTMKQKQKTKVSIKCWTSLIFNFTFTSKLWRASLAVGVHMCAYVCVHMDAHTKTCSFPRITLI